MFERAIRLFTVYQRIGHACTALPGCGRALGVSQVIDIAAYFLIFGPGRKFFLRVTGAAVAGVWPMPAKNPLPPPAALA
jgi:hypothetical protein